LKKSILLLIVLIFSAIFYSCFQTPADPEVNTEPPDPVAGMCGLPRFRVNSPGIGGYTATYLSTDNIRTFRYNIVSADTVCIYSKPRITWTAEANNTAGRTITYSGGVQWASFEKKNAGTKTVNSSGEHWLAVDSISMGTSFGTGPGRITTAYIDVSFQSHGDLETDQFYIYKRFADGGFSARIDYDYYVVN